MYTKSNLHSLTKKSFHTASVSLSAEWGRENATGKQKKSNQSLHVCC